MCPDGKQANEVPAGAKTGRRQPALRSLAELQAEFYKKRQQGRGSGSNESEAREASTLAGHMEKTVQTVIPPWQSSSSSQLPVAPAANPKRTGSVRRIFPAKGFGFIDMDQTPGRSTSGPAHDVFLHFSDLGPGVCSSDLAIGTKVVFFHDEAVDPQRAPGGSARKVMLAEPQMATLGLLRRFDLETSTYGRTDLLVVFAAMQSRGLLQQESESGHAKGGLYALHLPAGPRRGPVEDPALDDEACVAQMEARLAWESGADASNAETFGTSWAGQTWTFEEALLANRRLNEKGVLGKPHITFDQIEAPPGLPRPIGFERKWKAESDAYASTEVSPLVSSSSSEDGEESQDVGLVFFR